MKELEEKILKNFIKYEGKEVEGLDLIVCINEDAWPDDEGYYFAEVMENENNGMVWECTCTKSGKIKETYKL